MIDHPWNPPLKASRTASEVQLFFWCLWPPALMGVPQGSVHHPLLYLPFLPLIHPRAQMFRRPDYYIFYPLLGWLHELLHPNHHPVAQGPNRSSSLLSHSTSHLLETQLSLPWKYTLKQSLLPGVPAAGLWGVGRADCSCLLSLLTVNWSEHFTIRSFYATHPSSGPLFQALQHPQDLPCTPFDFVSSSPHPFPPSVFHPAPPTAGPFHLALSLCSSITLSYLKLSPSSPTLLYSVILSPTLPLSIVLLT